MKERSTHGIASELLEITGNDNATYFFTHGGKEISVADMHDYPTDDFIYIFAPQDSVDDRLLVTHISHGDFVHPGVCKPTSTDDEFIESMRTAMIEELERLKTK